MLCACVADDHIFMSVNSDNCTYLYFCQNTIGDGRPESTPESPEHGNAASAGHSMEKDNNPSTFETGDNSVSTAASTVVSQRALLQQDGRGSQEGDLARNHEQVDSSELVQVRLPPSMMVQLNNLDDNFDVEEGVTNGAMLSRLALCDAESENGNVKVCEAGGSDDDPEDDECTQAPEEYLSQNYDMIREFILKPGNRLQGTESRGMHTTASLLDKFEHACTRPVIDAALDRLRQEGVVKEGAAGEFHVVCELGDELESTNSSCPPTPAAQSPGEEYDTCDTPSNSAMMVQLTQAEEIQDPTSPTRVEPSNGQPSCTSMSAHSELSAKELMFHSSVRVIYEQSEDNGREKAVWTSTKLYQALKVIGISNTANTRAETTRYLGILAKAGLLGASKRRTRCFIASSTADTLYGDACRVLGIQDTERTPQNGGDIHAEVTDNDVAVIGRAERPPSSDTTCLISNKRTYDVRSPSVHAGSDSGGSERSEGPEVEGPEVSEGNTDCWEQGGNRKRSKLEQLEPYVSMTQESDVPECTSQTEAAQLPRMSTIIDPIQQQANDSDSDNESSAFFTQPL